MSNKKLGYYAPISFRKEILILMETQGFRWVALRSVDLNKPCSECAKRVSSAYSEVSSRCTVCIGIGYAYIDKLVKTYSYRGSPGINEQTPIGSMNTENLVWVLEHRSYPKTSDYILDLDTDEITGVPRQPFRITKAFKISDVQSMLSDDSRIGFWRCFAEETNIDLGKSST